MNPVKPEGGLPLNAHLSFPLSAPALQKGSIKPDFQYYDRNHARRLCELLGRSGPCFNACELSAIGLMGKVYLTLIQQFLSSSPDSFERLDHYLLKHIRGVRVQTSLAEVLDHFPTLLTYSDPSQKPSYNFGNLGDPARRHGFYYSLLLILVAEMNPAIRAKDGLFTDPQLRTSSFFSELGGALQDFFSNFPDKGSVSDSLFEVLLEPGRLYPDSLFDQLMFVSKRWKDLLDPQLLHSLMIGLDHLRETAIRGFQDKREAQNPLGYLDEQNKNKIDIVHFSPDQDWMPHVILQAKNVYVWLHQLSREYQISITRLDQIPDQELQRLSRRGVNALWLIGLWERSPASQKIKQLCGNPEAVSSAYSLFDYSISNDLGGEQAYQHLTASAAKCNIRLAADMVPNHMGIDSRWVLEHPEWFLSLADPPFPGYSYEGMDLSNDPAVSIYLEDHYYDQSDAAVVFKRVDNNTGETRFLYHGNDGTSMPWNDTAQLDYLNPEVREAVIQSILQVARKFPIIRFDAAMTLSKKHYQRLWFPEPGSGGAIPTRSGFSLTKDQFDVAMPDEFWRELVDRVAREVPDTLLLAEAFWMMEGYFVRNLGMHRVYNSAFMHMLRDEDNKKYRDLLVGTLAYDPQILKRYVNFMNNPDEETALSQFGSGGKYFGTCLLMSTLPGLPMFGHGQIEGYAEKYGMEYKKAYIDELPDPGLVEQHRREIVPLLFKRHLFSDVEHFVLYDLIKQDGSVDDNVFAFSNRSGGENALIIFYNKWGDTRGWVHKSTPLNGRTVDLLAGLGLSHSGGDFLTYEDTISGLEYIQPLEDLLTRGLYLELGAYQYHAFVNFKIATDHDGSLRETHNKLQGTGTSNLEKTRLDIQFAPLIEPILSLLSEWEKELSAGGGSGSFSNPFAKVSSLEFSHATGQSFYELLLSLFPDKIANRDSLMEDFQHRISCISSLHSILLQTNLFCGVNLLLPWAFLADLPQQLTDKDLEIILGSISDHLADHNTLSRYDRDQYLGLLSSAVFIYPLLAASPIDLKSLPSLWFSVPSVRRYSRLHIFEGQEWFHKESMESLIKLTHTLHHLILCLKKPSSPMPSVDQGLAGDYLNMLRAVDQSKCQADIFLGLLSEMSFTSG